jgi:hypothetical protein
MAVRLTKAFGTSWNAVRLHLAKDEVVPSGELANWLLAGGAPVEEIPAVVPDDEVEDVPDGTIAEVEAWIGEDPDRAARALAAELAKGDSARGTLVAKLEKLTGDH